MGLAASRMAIIGNYMFRRAKHSTTEVVAPKEEEEERTALRLSKLQPE